MSKTKAKLWPLILCALPILSACQNEHENKLISMPKQVVAEWLWENKNAHSDACSKHWADPKNALKTDLNYCKKFAKHLAGKMNYQGFAQGIIEEDLNLPLLWRDHHKRILENAAWEKHVIESQAQRKANPIFNRLERQREKIKKMDAMNKLEHK